MSDNWPMKTTTLTGQGSYRNNTGKASKLYKQSSSSSSSNDNNSCNTMQIKNIFEQSTHKICQIWQKIMLITFTILYITGTRTGHRTSVENGELVWNINNTCNENIIPYYTLFIA